MSSHHTRGEWIEINPDSVVLATSYMSRPTRGVWIKINISRHCVRE